MNLASQSARDLLPLLESREVSNEEIVRAVLDRIESREPEVQAFLTVRDERDLLSEAAEIDKRRSRGQPIGVLQGLPVAVKDNFCTRGLRTTCASRMLDTFVPPYDATVVGRIRGSDGILLGKTNLDEFAMGSTTENSAFQKTRNPHNLDYVPGGTSGGSAAALAANETILAIGSDTGGSVRQPAAFCGVVGLKPTYGRVSRYGLVAHASSFDQPGPLGKTVYDAALLLSVMAGRDDLDATSALVPVPSYHEGLAGAEGLRFGIPRELLGQGLDDETKRATETTIQALTRDGHTILDIEIPHYRYALSTYYILVCSEASSNLARYDGVKYGYRSPSATTLRELYKNTRTEGFGPEVKRRIMLGTFALSSGYYDAYYSKAEKVRQLIRDDFAAAFSVCDFILHPVSPVSPFRLGEKIDNPLSMYLADVFSVLANLVGSPAISVPAGRTRSGLPIGMQLTARHFEEQQLLSIGNRLEALIQKSKDAVSDRDEIFSDPLT